MKFMFFLTIYLLKCNQNITIIVIDVRYLIKIDPV